MKTAKIIFENPKHNYMTSVNGKLSDSEIKAYYEGKMFNVGVYPHENLQKCIKCEII